MTCREAIFESETPTYGRLPGANGGVGWGADLRHPPDADFWRFGSTGGKRVDRSGRSRIAPVFTLSKRSGRQRGWRRYSGRAHPGEWRPIL
jgi:hypothetical protein